MRQGRATGAGWLTVPMRIELGGGGGGGGGGGLFNSFKKMKGPPD